MITNLIFKIASPCNLRCTYCYEYNAGDESWKEKPAFVNLKVVRALGLAIKQYAFEKSNGEMNVTLHGGEPLLLGKRRLQLLTVALRSAAAPVKVNLIIQTNGILLNEEIIGWAVDNNVQIGFSLDGPEGHNASRLDIKGRPTFGTALEKLKLLQKLAPRNLIGLLAVINLKERGSEAVSFLCSLGVRNVDLLLPFETWDSLGDGREQWSRSLSDWLNDAFDAWVDNPIYSQTKIRIFEDAIQSLITGKPRTDWFGPRSVNYLVIDTSGQIDVLDHLKVIGSESGKVRSTNLNIEDCSIGDAVKAVEIALSNWKANLIPTQCEPCKLASLCCGGYLPHRYSNQNFFNNRSVACEAIMGMFDRAEGLISRSGNA
jgi:uncharacterized protein